MIRSIAIAVLLYFFWVEYQENEHLKSEVWRLQDEVRKVKLRGCYG